MGADIHFYIETRLSKSDKWDTSNFHRLIIEKEDDDERVYLQPTIGKQYSSYGSRDYTMFGILAGVRRSGCLYEPRGTPNDVSDNLQRVIDDWGSDAHSNSYLSLEEFKRCLDLYEKREKCINPGFVDIYNIALEWITYELAESKLLETGLEPEIRFVFFFDN